MRQLHTVEAAAIRLRLHKKTVLRYIREGRLRATRVGKAYRILGEDLDTFAGVELLGSAPEVRVTAIVDIPDVDPPMLQRLTSTLLGAAAGRPASADGVTLDIAHDPVRRTVKVVIIGPPAAVATLLTFAETCVEAP